MKYKNIEVESINELTSFAIIKDFQFGKGTADYTISNTDITLTMERPPPDGLPVVLGQMIHLMIRLMIH